MPNTPTDSLPLPRTMRAVVCHGPEDYRLEELPTPQAGPGEVVIRVDAAGICASDVKCYLGAPMLWGDAHRIGYCQAPITAGHEFVGTVVGAGRRRSRNSTGWQLGDRAVSEQIVPCWQCRYCRRGLYHLCAVHDIYGFRRRTPGGWAEYLKFPTGAINHKVPACPRRSNTPPSSSRWPAPCMRSGAAASSSAMSWSWRAAATIGLGIVAYAA